MSLPESLERAASEMADLADQIRPANGDPSRLLEELGTTEAGQLLAWILSEQPADAAELLEAWGEDDAGVAILLALPDDGIAKPGRKLLRKARHRLRSQGIAAAGGESVATVKRSVVSANDRWQAAHLSSPDFRGARMGYLVDSHPAGGARLFEIRFDEGRGILDFKIYSAGRSKVRGFLRSLTEGAGQRLFEVDRDALRALVWRASQAQPDDRPLPTSFVEWRTRLFSDELEKVSTPGGLAREALGAGELAPSLETLVQEVKNGSLGPWPPTTSLVSEWMDRGREAVEGLEGEARATRIESWIDEITVSLQEATDDVLISRHLDELAWVRWQAGLEGEAQRLLTVSSALSTDSGVSKAFTRARVESLFAPYLADLRVIEQSALDPEDGDD